MVILNAHGGSVNNVVLFATFECIDFLSLLGKRQL